MERVQTKDIPITNELSEEEKLLLKSLVEDFGEKHFGEVAQMRYKLATINILEKEKELLQRDKQGHGTSERHLKKLLKNLDATPAHPSKDFLKHLTGKIVAQVVEKFEKYLKEDPDFTKSSKQQEANEALLSHIHKAKNHVRRIIFSNLRDNFEYIQNKLNIHGRFNVHEEQEGKEKNMTVTQLKEKLLMNQIELYPRLLSFFRAATQGDGQVIFDVDEVRKKRIRIPIRLREFPKSLEDTLEDTYEAYRMSNDTSLKQQLKEFYDIVHTKFKALKNAGYSLDLTFSRCDATTKGKVCQEMYVRLKNKTVTPLMFYILKKMIRRVGDSIDALRRINPKDFLTHLEHAIEEATMIPMIENKNDIHEHLDNNTLGLTIEESTNIREVAHAAMDGACLRLLGFDPEFKEFEKEEKKLEQEQIPSDLLQKEIQMTKNEYGDKITTLLKTPMHDDTKYMLEKFLRQKRDEEIELKKSNVDSQNKILQNKKEEHENLKILKEIEMKQVMRELQKAQEMAMEYILNSGKQLREYGQKLQKYRKVKGTLAAETDFNSAYRSFNLYEILFAYLCSDKPRSRKMLYELQRIANTTNHIHSIEKDPRYLAVKERSMSLKEEGTITGREYQISFSKLFGYKISQVDQNHIPKSVLQVDDNEEKNTNIPLLYERVFIPENDFELLPSVYYALAGARDKSVERILEKLNIRENVIHINDIYDFKGMMLVLLPQRSELDTEFEKKYVYHLMEHEKLSAEDAKLRTEEHKKNGTYTSYYNEQYRKSLKILAHNIGTHNLNCNYVEGDKPTKTGEFTVIIGKKGNENTNKAFQSGIKIVGKIRTSLAEKTRKGIQVEVQMNPLDTWLENYRKGSFDVPKIPKQVEKAIKIVEQHSAKTGNCNKEKKIIAEFLNQIPKELHSPAEHGMYGLKSIAINEKISEPQAAHDSNFGVKHEYIDDLTHAMEIWSADYDHLRAFVGRAKNLGIIS